ncbi:MAG TPA: alpha/beta fold hydrolase [Jiangellaceae bacterium]|nr:alpha/beta fold hydrolase [Jiangellaceae bacterium]
MGIHRRRWVLPALVGALVASACTATEPVGEPAVTTAATTSATPSARTPATAPRVPSPEPLPHPVSIQALIQQEYIGGGLQLGAVLEQNDRYTRYVVTYLSNGLTISGIMNVPVGDGPFPVLVLNHGYIDPDVYTNGRGLRREQDYLARRGFAVLHTDYRGHAQSDDDPDAEIELRLGYTEDVINAVLAIKSSELPYLDDERIGLLGRSMGGGITYNALVARPGLVDAAVVYAPVSSNTADNFNRWTREDSALATQIIAAYGSPEESPDFWQQVSPVTYFDRITEPILIHHGTADESCPIAWSVTTASALKALGKDAELVTYEGEPHAFEAAWADSMATTVAFFERHLSAS